MPKSPCARTLTTKYTHSTGSGSGSSVNGDCVLNHLRENPGGPIRVAAVQRAKSQTEMSLRQILHGTKAFLEVLRGAHKVSLTQTGVGTTQDRRVDATANKRYD